MPALSPTMESGSIASWTIREGDAFAAGDALCSIETDKASVDFEAQDDGILAKILVQPSDGDVPCGTSICVVVEEADEVAAFADYVAPPPEAAAAAAPTAPSEPAVAVAAAPQSSSTPSMLFPSARHLAESRGKDATVLSGSGKGGRVTKGDVLAALQAGSLPDLVQSTTSAPAAATAAPSPTASTSTAAAAAATTFTRRTMVDVDVPEIASRGPYDDVPNNKMRKIIASRLTESKRDVPHSYTSMEIRLDNVLALRKTLQQQAQVKVSVNDFIIRCAALALRDVPEVNATYRTKTGTVQRQDAIDVSVAVATPTGLITPIVFGADHLGLSEITSTVADLAGRARTGKLQPHEYQGGSFSVSNLGMFGIAAFSAVINPPQAAILAVGGGTPTLVPRPYHIDDNDDKATPMPPQVQTVMTACLSADRRVVDEATASLFLQAFQQYMQKPELLLL